MFCGRFPVSNQEDGPAPSLDTVRIFQSRKRRAFRWGGATFLVGVGALIATIAGQISIPNYVSILVAGAGAVIGLSYLSCPACKQVPHVEQSSLWTDDGGFILNPEFCPACRVRLR